MNSSVPAVPAMPAIARKSSARRTPDRRPPPQDTRDRIVAASLRAFADHGFEGAKTRDIAAAAGVNQGLITYHFATKDALWRAAVDAIFGELQRVLGARLAALEDVAPPARLRALVKHFVRFSAAHPELHRLMVQECGRGSDRMKWLVDHHVKPLFDVSTELIRRAQREGVASRMSPALVHYMLLGAATHIFLVAPEYRRLTGADPSDPDTVEAYAEAVATALVDEPPGEGPAARRRSR